MKGHIRNIAKKRFSDFIRLENGKVGSGNALTVSAIVSISALSAMLLAPNAHAVHTCPDGKTVCNDSELCCSDDQGKFFCWLGASCP